MKYLLKASAGTFLILCTCHKPARLSLRLCGWISDKEPGLYTALLSQDTYSQGRFHQYFFDTHDNYTYTHKYLFIQVISTKLYEKFGKKIINSHCSEGTSPHQQQSKVHILPCDQMPWNLSEEWKLISVRDRSGCRAVSLSDNSHQQSSHFLKSHLEESSVDMILLGVSS